MPKHVQKSLSQPSRESGHSYKDVTILFADIVGFTAYSSGKPPKMVVNMLSELFMDFDKMCNTYKLFKVYTIGDCYVVLSNLESRDSPKTEAQIMFEFAEKLIGIIQKVKLKINFDGLDMRIGIHTGDIIGGIVGTDIVRFDIYGENVWVGNKMESAGEAGKICVSEYTKSLLERNSLSRYRFYFNKEISVPQNNKKINSFFCKKIM